MSEKIWYYRKGEDERGPFSLEEMCAKLESEEITEETFVKCQGFDEWRHVSEVKEFHVEYLDTTPPIAKHETKMRSYLEEERTKKWVRPWVRFWARLFDYILFALLFSPIFSLQKVPALFYFLLFPVGLTFTWVFIEALLLSTWGSTPGKWLFCIKVRRENGEIPNYRFALSRSIAVFWLGLGGALFPIITLITGSVANVKLSNLGITTWDRQYGFIVDHEKMGFFRTFVATLFFVFSFSFFYS